MLCINMVGCSLFLLLQLLFVATSFGTQLQWYINSLIGGHWTDRRAGRGKHLIRMTNPLECAKCVSYKHTLYLCIWQSKKIPHVNNGWDRKRRKNSQASRWTHSSGIFYTLQKSLLLLLLFVTGNASENNNINKHARTHTEKVWWTEREKQKPLGRNKRTKPLGRAEKKNMCEIFSDDISIELSFFSTVHSIVHLSRPSVRLPDRSICSIHCFVCFWPLITTQNRTIFKLTWIWAPHPVERVKNSQSNKLCQYGVVCRDTVLHSGIVVKKTQFVKNAQGASDSEQCDSECDKDR